MEEEPDDPGQGKQEYQLSICVIVCEFHCCCWKIAELSDFPGVPECTKDIETVLSSLPSFYMNLVCIKLVY